MNKQFYKKHFCWIAILCLPLIISAQDIHYSNFGYSPLNINPALTGVFAGDYRISGTYRNQWRGVPVSYRTFSGSFDMRFGSREKPLIERRWSMGLLFNNDVAGYSRLSNNNIGLTGSYIAPLSNQDFLTLGASYAFHQRRFSTGDLTWDDQYRDKQFDPTYVSGDIDNFDRSNSYGNIATGINYHHQKPNKRSAFDLGLGLYNVNKPNVSFTNDPDYKLPMRYSLYSGINIQVSSAFDILLEAMGQWQGPHRELIGSLGGRLYIEDKPTKQIAVQMGISVRGRDAIAPHLGFIYNNWKASVTFDANISNFRAASKNLGGPEISLIYIFSKVPPGTYCPICPTYL